MLRYVDKHSYLHIHIAVRMPGGTKGGSQGNQGRELGETGCACHRNLPISTLNKNPISYT